MKKSIFLFFLLSLAGTRASSQVFFHEDFQQAAVNNFSVADLDEATWTLYNDGNEPVTIPDMSYFDQAWKILRDEDGSMQAASLSFFDEPAQADRWMVSSAIDLSSAQAPGLIFRAKAMDGANRDGFEVRLSTSGTEKEDFTEVLESVSRAKASWEYYRIDLSPYKGQSVHIAFVQNSEDRYLICIDDICVGENAENQVFVAAISSPANSVLQAYPQNIQVTAEVANPGSNPVSSFRIQYRADEGQMLEQAFENLDLQPGSAHKIVLDIPVSASGRHSVEISVVEANQVPVESPATSTSFFSVLASELPHKTAFLELFSSGTCSSCVAWNEALHEFFVEHDANVADNSSNLVVAKYQTEIPVPGDPFVTAETLGRASHYGIFSAPSFYLNGKRITLDAETYVQDLVDSIENCRAQPSSLGLQARLSRQENTFSVETEVTAFLPEQDPYNLFVCLMEDSIYYMTGTGNGEKNFYYIVRKMLPSYMGQTLPSLQIGESQSNTFQYTFNLDEEPKIYSSLDNVNAVVFLQNARTNDIIQARYLKTGYVPASNEETAPVPASLLAYPNPASSQLHLRLESASAQNVQVKVFNLSGQQLRHFDWNVQAGTNHFEMETESLPEGTYLIAVYEKQAVRACKIVVR